MKLKDVIKRWYEGKYVPPDNPPNSIVVFPMGHYERHWSSRLVHAIVKFWVKEWKWLLSFIIATIGLVVAIAKFF